MALKEEYDIIVIDMETILEDAERTEFAEVMYGK